MRVPNLVCIFLMATSAPTWGAPDARPMTQDQLVDATAQATKASAAAVRTALLAVATCDDGLEGLVGGPLQAGKTVVIAEFGSLSLKAGRVHFTANAGKTGLSLDSALQKLGHAPVGQAIFRQIAAAAKSGRPVTLRCLGTFATRDGKLVLTPAR